MNRFLDDDEHDDCFIGSRNDLFLTTVAGSYVEGEHHQQPTGSMFQFCVYHRSSEFFGQFSNHKLCQGLPVPCN
jgi:hypothetical protein